MEKEGQEDKKREEGGKVREEIEEGGQLPAGGSSGSLQT